MATTTPQQTPLTNDTFSEFVRTHRFVVVHFWAIWNGYDRLMKRLLESQIPDELRAEVTFARFDIDPPAHHELCRQLTVVNVPFLALYRDGVLIRTISGLRTPEDISELLRELVYGPTS